MICHYLRTNCFFLFFFLFSVKIPTYLDHPLGDTDFHSSLACLALGGSFRGDKRQIYARTSFLLCMVLVSYTYTCNLTIYVCTHIVGR